MTDTSDLPTHTAPPGPAELDPGSPVGDTDTGEIVGDTDTGDAAAADHELVALVCRLVGDVDSHAARLSRVEERTDSLGSFVDRFEETFTGLGTDTDTGGSALSPGPAADPADTASPAAAPGDDEQPTGLDMRELVAWVGDNVAALLERKIPQTGGAPYWCRRWWRHPEAIARFEAARRCWVEAVAGQGAAMVVYFEHLDAMLAALCGENGPFCGCVGGQHNDTGISTPLGQDEPNEDYYRSFENPDDSHDY